MTVQFMHVSAAQTITNTNTNTTLTEKLFLTKLAKATLVKCSQICLHALIH